MTGEAQGHILTSATWKGPPWDQRLQPRCSGRKGSLEREWEREMGEKKGNGEREKGKKKGSGQRKVEKKKVGKGKWEKGNGEKGRKQGKGSRGKEKK